MWVLLANLGPGRCCWGEHKTCLDSCEKCSVGESSLNALCPVTCLWHSGFSRKILEMPLCSGLWGAVLFPQLPQLGTGNFLLCSALLEGSGLDGWVGCGWAHGMGAEDILVTLCSPHIPWHDLGRSSRAEGAVSQWCFIIITLTNHNYTVELCS